MISIRRQRGATLMVTLIMLVVLTLFAVTAFNLSGVNLKIVGNYQQQRSIEAVVQQAIDQSLSTINIFTAPADTTVNVCTQYLLGVCASSYTITVNAPVCKYTTTAKGYTKKIGELTPQDNNWEVRASYTDTFSKASVVIVQGVAIRMLAGNCTNW